MDGVIVVDKAAGWTSHDVVNKLRRIVGTRRAGHLGTLDPAATGVLPLVIGRATRLAQFYTRNDKTYEDYLGKKGLKRLGKKKWNKVLRKAIDTMEALFNYDHLYLGGGNARKIKGDLPPRTTIVSNVAGLLGGVKLWGERRGAR